MSESLQDICRKFFKNYSFRSINVLMMLFLFLPITAKIAIIDWQNTNDQLIDSVIFSNQSIAIINSQALVLKKQLTFVIKTIFFLDKSSIIN